MNDVNHPAKYLRMMQRWAETSQRMKASTTHLVEASGVRFPPKRWAKDSLVRKTMTGLWGDRYTNYRELLEQAKSKSVVPEFPIHIDIDIIDSCNLLCKSCSENHRPWTRARLDLDWLRSDPVFARGKLCAVNIGNANEPFLQPARALELIRFFREREVMDIFVHTNGTLFDEAMIDELIRTPPTWLTISIDAFTEETYQDVRGRGFQAVVAGVHEVLKKRNAAGSALPFVRVSFIAQPEGVGEMWDFYSYWKQYVDMVEFQEFGAANPIGHEVTPHVADDPLFELDRDSQCSMPFYRMAVMPGKGIGPCCSSYGQLDELRLGDIDSKVSILERWNAEKMKSIREGHRSPAGPEDLAVCRQCLRQNYVFKHYAPSESE